MDKVVTSPRLLQKKARETAVAAPAAVEQDVASNSESALRRTADKIVALNRRSAAHAYELGESFAEAKALVPEKKFGQWLKQFSDYTVRSAWNYISIHENLQDYRDRLLAHGVMPTVMFELAKAHPDEIDTIVARMDAGERIKVKDVRAALGAQTKKAKQDDASMMDVGGPAGLRKLAERKIEEDSEKFFKLATGILNHVENAMQPLAKRRAVFKGPLQKVILDDCRHAHDLMNSVAAPLQPTMTAEENLRPARLPEGTAWGQVQALLDQMRSEYGWPGKDDFVPWLQKDVIPLLRFVVHGEALSGSTEDLDEADDGEASAPDVDEGFLSYAEMPSGVQQTIDNALEEFAPEEREAMRGSIVYDPKPRKQWYKKIDV